MASAITRMNIVKSMLKLVRSHRFSDITIDDICSKANVSRRTFYRYYTDKYELLRDVYVECFFSKIERVESKSYWDTLLEICEHIYSDKDFFRHSFEVQGQNGFKEEVRNLLMPYVQRQLPSNEVTDKRRDFFIATGFDRIFLILEEWMKSGMSQPPEEFVDEWRASFYVYGTWLAELAAGRERSEFKGQKIADLLPKE